MNYLGSAFFGMLLISCAPTLSKYAMRGMSPKHLLTVSTAFMLFYLCMSCVREGDNLLRLFAPSRYSAVAALLGLVFTGSLLFYYRALFLGPATEVIPIWGLQIVFGSLLAAMAFREEISINKFVGIGLAVSSIWFISRE